MTWKCRCGAKRPDHHHVGLRDGRFATTFADFFPARRRGGNARADPMGKRSWDRPIRWEYDVQKQEGLCAGRHSSARVLASYRLQPVRDGCAAQSCQYFVACDYRDGLDHSLTGREICDPQLIDEVDLPVGTQEWDRRILYFEQQRRHGFRESLRVSRYAWAGQQYKCEQS